MCIRDSLVGDGELIVDQAIGDLHPDSTGKTLLTVGRGVGEGDRVFLAGKFPQFLVEALVSAVEAVLPLVGRNTVPSAVDGESRPADAVGAAADGSAKAGVQRPLALQFVISKADVRHLSVRSGTRIARTDAP